MHARPPDPASPRGPRQRRPAPQPVPEPMLRRQLKSRDRIREVDGVRQLACVEAPTVAVRIQAGVTATAQEARNAPPGTIFLDGSAECAPFADPVRRLYNLDHHEG